MKAVKQGKCTAFSSRSDARQRNMALRLKEQRLAQQVSPVAAEWLSGRGGAIYFETPLENTLRTTSGSLFAEIERVTPLPEADDSMPLDDSGNIDIGDIEFDITFGIGFN